MACLEHATVLDPAVRAAVEERGAVTRGDWDRLRLLEHLDSLALGSGAVAGLDPSFPPLPGVQALTVVRRSAASLPTCLGKLFPAVRKIIVGYTARLGPHTLDLAPLAALPELAEVVVNHQETALRVLSDALPPHVTVTVTPRPRT